MFFCFYACILLYLLTMVMKNSAVSGSWWSRKGFSWSTSMLLNFLLRQFINIHWNSLACVHLWTDFWNDHHIALEEGKRKTPALNLPYFSPISFKEVLLKSLLIKIRFSIFPEISWHFCCCWRKIWVSIWLTNCLNECAKSIKRSIRKVRNPDCWTHQHRLFPWRRYVP